MRFIPQIALIYGLVAQFAISWPFRYTRKTIVFIGRERMQQ